MRGASLGARDLTQGGIDDAVFLVDKDDGGLPPACFVRLELRERRQDDEIAGARMVRRRAVDADDAAVRLSAKRVRHEACPTCHVPDVDLLVLQDLSRLHQIGTDGHAPLVVEVRVRDRGAMDLRLEQVQAHSSSSLGLEVRSGLQVKRDRSPDVRNCR